MAFKGSNTNPSKFSKDQIPFFIFLIPLALFMILPITLIIFNAFKPMDELFAYPPRFFVTRPTLQNFTDLSTTAKSSLVPISRYIFNSILITSVVVVASVIISSMAGFALSKMQFKAKKWIFTINNAALMFVPVAVTIPRYLVIDFLHVTDTFLAHVLPLLAMPVSLFLIKQFIDQIPDSLIEAATVDGAGAFTIYYKVMLPLIRPAIATGAILSFQLVWNNIETSTLFINSENLRTVAFYMNTLALNGAIAGQGMAAAASLIMFLPNLILFIILQSNVMNTMAHSGLK